MAHYCLIISNAEIFVKNRKSQSNQQEWDVYVYQYFSFYLDGF